MNIMEESKILNRLQIFMYKTNIHLKTTEIIQTLKINFIKKNENYTTFP